MSEMSNLIQVMENECAEVEGEDRQEFESQREEIKNKNAEEYNVLKIQLEGNIEGLERQFDEAHKSYTNATEHRSRAFDQLSKKDASAARVVEMRTKKLRRLQVNGLSLLVSLPVTSRAMAGGLDTLETKDIGYP